MKTKDISQIVVGLLVMVSFIVVLWAVFKIEMPAANRDLALILLGVLASKFGDVVGWHFNSSKGSSEKTDIISKLPPVTILLAPILLLGLLSCSTVKAPISEVPMSYREKVVERLVPVLVKDDSLTLKALFECDSTNQVILKRLSEEKSKGVYSNFTFDDGILEYDAKAKHDTIYLPAKDSIVYQDKPVRVEVQTVTNRLTKWQGFQIVAFRMMGIALALWLVAKYFGNKIKTVFKSLLKP